MENQSCVLLFRVAAQKQGRIHGNPNHVWVGRFRDVGGQTGKSKLTKRQRDRPIIEWTEKWLFESRPKKIAERQSDRDGKSKMEILITLDMFMNER